MNERNCCDAHGVNCEQGRDCPARNVIDFQSRAGLHRAFMGGNSSGSAFIDLFTMYHVRVPLWFSRINWGPLFGLLLIVVCGALVLTGLYGWASAMGWTELLAALAAAPWSR